MKIVGCVVLYQPSEQNIAHIVAYAHLFDDFYVLDNSDFADSACVVPLCALRNVQYISMGGNQGIAAALRLGLEYAINDEADFCLTMDQDSTFPVESMGEIREYLSRSDIDDYAIIALNYEGTDTEKKLVCVPTWITSGNFINVKNYRLIKGFREELFIDSVDHELCHQFYVIGKKVAYINHIRIGHSLGNPSDAYLFGRHVTLPNHSPLRYYYRFRNNFVLYREDKRFFRGIRRADRHQVIKILLFENNKTEKLRMICRGIRDAKAGKLGKFEG